MPNLIVSLLILSLSLLQQVQATPNVPASLQSQIASSVQEALQLVNSYEMNESAPSSSSCSFASENVADGQSVTAYQAPRASSCASHVRTCSNGTLSGDAIYQYSSCTATAATSNTTFNATPSSGGAPLTVTFNGGVSSFSTYTIDFGDGQSDTYVSCPSSAPLGQFPCPLSPISHTYTQPGSYVARLIQVNYCGASDGGTCTPPPPTTLGSATITVSSSNSGSSSCSFASENVADGQSVTAYQAPRASSCASQVRTCSNGTLSGDAIYQYSSCTATATCPAYGTECAVGYIAQSPGKDSNGCELPPTCVAATSSCTFNGQTIANGQSVTAYRSSNVPYGQSCVSQPRTCTNGTLSGDAVYQYASCSVSAAPALSVACSPTAPSITAGGSVTWIASASGGAGGYGYSWADTLGHTASTYSTASWAQSYTSSGSVGASVSINDSAGHTASASCGSVNVTAVATPPDYVVTAASMNPANAVSSGVGAFSSMSVTVQNEGGNVNNQSIAILASCPTLPNFQTSILPLAAGQSQTITLANTLPNWDFQPGSYTCTVKADYFETFGETNNTFGFPASVSGLPRLSAPTGL